MSSPVPSEFVLWWQLRGAVGLSRVRVHRPLHWTVVSVLQTGASGRSSVKQSAEGLVTGTCRFAVPCNFNWGITRLRFAPVQVSKHQMRVGCWIWQSCKLLSACKGILRINVLVGNQTVLQKNALIKSRFVILLEVAELLSYFFAFSWQKMLIETFDAHPTCLICVSQEGRRGVARYFVICKVNKNTSTICRVPISWLLWMIFFKGMLFYLSAHTKVWFWMPREEDSLCLDWCQE